MPKNTRDYHRAFHMGQCLTHLTHDVDEGEQFLHCIVVGDETWVNHNTGNHRRALTWKHSFVFPSKEFQSNANSKEDQGKCFGTMNLLDW
jgi:hypothetical protein